MTTAPPCAIFAAWEAIETCRDEAISRDYGGSFGVWTSWKWPWRAFTARARSSWGFGGIAVCGSGDERKEARRQRRRNRPVGEAAFCENATSG